MMRRTGLTSGQSRAIRGWSCARRCARRSGQCLGSKHVSKTSCLPCATTACSPHHGSTRCACCHIDMSGAPMPVSTVSDIESACTRQQAQLLCLRSLKQDWQPLAESRLLDSPQKMVCSAQDFREPLYLTDKVLQLPDTRSDEDIRYPELFRHRIEAAH